MITPTQNRNCAHKGCVCVVTDGQSCCAQHRADAALELEPRIDSGRHDNGHAACTHLLDDRTIQP